ncbi:hypothetical protein SISSUDRAFT_1067625 [Sistotremastrum suecicum HHB10207 ss-3]|uniref:Uncharacterized protein n=1 Tax=Sistotremastrum suecicum HHB10207 ss-3 TaxID=1314776 RepID=A0A165WX15_9AGAM|nr:hypothetical protein SISSUDRAFT_1067625 [Sistotremastrum suecicum HHB10207 ss-3]
MHATGNRKNCRSAPAAGFGPVAARLLNPNLRSHIVSRHHRPPSVVLVVSSVPSILDLEIARTNVVQANHRYSFDHRAIIRLVRAFPKRPATPFISSTVITLISLNFCSACHPLPVFINVPTSPTTLESLNISLYSLALHQDIGQPLLKYAQTTHDEDPQVNQLLKLLVRAASLAAQ